MARERKREPGIAYAQIHDRQGVATRCEMHKIPSARVWS